MADDFAVPHPGFWIDRLSDGSEQPQTIETMLLGPLVSPFEKSANGSGCGVEDVHLVAIDDAPEAILFRKVGRPFVHQAGGPVLQRPVHDVAVARHPSDVRRTPVGVLFLEIEHPLGGEICRY